MTTDDTTKFDNDVVCTKVYAWCKEQSQGREPYSPFVADVTMMVLGILKLERGRPSVRDRIISWLRGDLKHNRNAQELANAIAEGQYENPKGPPF